MSNSPVKRRALFVTFAVPESPEAGENGFHRRQGLLIDAIKNTGCEIEILLFSEQQDKDEVYLKSFRNRIQETLNSLWGGDFRVTVCSREPIPDNSSSLWHRYIVPALSFFRQSSYLGTSGMTQVSAFENCLSRQPDFVFIHRLACMPPVLLSRKKLPPVFLDMDDIEHISFARSISQPPRWASKYLEYLSLPSLIFGEWMSIRRCSNVLVCSEGDRKKLTRLFFKKNVVAIPNSVSKRVNGNVLASAKSVLLLGDYRYNPNLIGAEFLIDNIWPRIIEAVPDAVLTVAGHRSDLIRQSVFSPKGVVFPGFLPDLDAAYADARVVVCPILSGGGTRVKIIEAAAYGKPIVSTKIGAEGIELKDNHEIFIRDKPRDFAGACIDLLQDYQMASDVGLRAAQAVERNYDRQSAISKLSGILVDSYSYRKLDN